MLALTGGAPKELMPLAGALMLTHVVRETAASGITDLVIVIAPGKEAIVEQVAPLAGTRGMPERISFLEQSEARGLADAIRLGREFASGEALAVALPDNLFLADRPALAQVIDRYEETKRNVVAIVEISAHEAARRGATSIYAGSPRGDAFEIDFIPNKRDRAARFDTGGASSAFSGVGRYVLDRHAFDAIDEVERSLTPGTELDDVPVLQRLLAAAKLTGRLVRGRFLDLGLPEGFQEAEQALTVGEGRTVS